MRITDFEKTLEQYRGATPEVRDELLERAGFELLSKLECRLARLQDSQGLKRMLTRFEALREMLIEVIEFINAEFGTDALADDVQAICELRDRMKSLEHAWRRFSVGSLFSLRSSTDEARREAYARLLDEAMKVFARLLDYPSKRFHSEQKIHEWRQSCVSFLEDFRQRW